MNLTELYKGFLKWSWPTLQSFEDIAHEDILFPCKSLSLQITAE